jgi:hypothetical protein
MKEAQGDTRHGPADRLRQGYGESRRSGFAAEAEAGHYVLTGLKPCATATMTPATATMTMDHRRWPIDDGRSTTID